MRTNRFEYQFKFGDDSTKTYTIELENFLIKEANTSDQNIPTWANLDFHKCANCPLSSTDVQYCPVARNLASLAEEFKDEKSFTSVRVFVKTDSRSYGKNTDLQSGLQSIFGLIMGTSACPHMSLFRTAAHFHLPFSTEVETLVRLLGFHLIKEYLKHEQDPSHKIGVESLIEQYRQVVIVNRGILERVKAIAKGDANMNAIVVLDNFASLLPLEASADWEDLRTLFL